MDSESMAPHPTTPHSPPSSSVQLQSFFLHHTQQQQQSPPQSPNPNPIPDANPGPSPELEPDTTREHEDPDLSQNDPHQGLHHHQFGFDVEEAHATPAPTASHHLREESNDGSTSNFFFSHTVHIPSAIRPSSSPSPNPNPNPNQTSHPNPNPNPNVSIHAQESDLKQNMSPLQERHEHAGGIIAMGSPSMDPLRRKRGRPRKYSLNLMREGYSSPFSTAARRGLKKARMMNIVPGYMDQGFRPHIIAIAAGEDVLMRMMSFWEEEENSSMCILSARGVISNVALTSGGTKVTYEGRYDILSISGSFFQNQGGVVSVSLAGPDGRIIGGKVEGVFVAATPIKVVMGTFLSKSHETHTQAQEDIAQISHPVAVEANNPAFYEPLQKQLLVHGQSPGGSDEPQAYHSTHDVDVTPSQSSDWRLNQINENT